MKHPRLLLTVSLLAVAISAPKAIAGGAKWASYVLIGADLWNTNVSGEVYTTTGSTAGTNIGLDQDLGLGQQTNPSFVLDVHHGMRSLPDVLVQYDRVVSDGASYLTRQITYNGVTYKADGTLLSQAVLQQGRLILYWNPIDNELVDFRAGFGTCWENLRLSVAGQVRVTAPGGLTQTGAASEAVSGVVWSPMVSVGVVFRLPAGFSLATEASYASYASNYLFDASLGAAVRLPFGLVLNAGYRRLKITLDDTSLPVNGEVQFRGPYAGLAWQF